MAKSIDYIHTTVSSEVSTTTSTGYVEVVESAALTPGKTYHIICHALCEGSHSGSVFLWRLYDRTNDAAVADSAILREPTAANETESYFFVGQITAGSEGGGIEFQQQAAASRTARTQFVSMLILDLSEMRSSDYFLVNDSTNTSHTTSFADRVSTTRNTTAGDEWLIFGWGAVTMDSTSKPTSMTLSYTNGGSTSTSNEISFEGEDATELLSYYVSRSFTIGTSGSTTWKIQSKDNAVASDPNNYEASTILGIRLNAFADFGTFYNASAVSHSASAFEEDATVSYTPSQTGNNIVAASSVYVPGAKTYAAFSRVQVGGSSSPNAVPDSQRNGVASDPTDKLPLSTVTTFSGTRGAASTVDFDSKRANETTNQNVTDRSLVVFSTELNYDSPTVTGKMRRPGMFRRGGGRKTSKRMRR